MPVLPRPSRPPTTSLDSIRIATDEIVLDGSVAPTGQRITDMLLRGQDVAFLPRGAEPAPQAWIAVAPADILWVVPPPLPPRRGWHAEAGSVRIDVRIGPYRIVGSAHLPPGTPVDRRLAGTHPFLPLTAARIALEGDERSEDADVVIVNLTRASAFRSLD